MVPTDSSVVMGREGRAIPVPSTFPKQTSRGLTFQVHHPQSWPGAGDSLPRNIGKGPAFRITVSQNNDTCLREAQCCVLGVRWHQPRAGTQVQLPGSSAQPSRPWRGGRWKCLVRGDQHREILAQQKSYCPNQDLPKDGKSRSSWTPWSRSNGTAFLRLSRPRGSR